MNDPEETQSGVIDDSFAHVFMTLGHFGYCVSVEHVEAIIKLSESDPNADIDRITRAYAKANKLPKRNRAAKPD